MKLLRYFLLFIASGIVSLASIAQETVTVTVAPTQYVLPPHLGKYLEVPSNYFTLTLRNNTEQTQYVYMGMQIDQIMPTQEMHVITPPARMPQIPITLAPGETKALNPVEMKTMFNHLAMSDISVAGEAKNGLLPEGTYEACLTAYKYDPTLTSPYPLSNPLNGHCTFRICYLSDAPQFLMPEVDVASQLGTSSTPSRTDNNLGKSSLGSISRAGAVGTTSISTGRGNALGGVTLTNTVDYGSDLASLSVATLREELPQFMWTAPYNNCGIIGTNVTYTLTIKEMMPGQSAYEAMDYGTTIWNKPGIVGTQYILPKSVTDRMYASMTYVAQLTAESSAVEGAMNFMSFNNDGKSEIRLFRIKRSGETTRTIDNGTITPRSITPDIPNTDDDEEDYSVIWGNSSSKDGVNPDALYTFRNPTISSPTFLDGVARKVFINDDMNVEWRDVWHIGGEGLHPEDLQFEYDVELFNGGNNPDRELALSGTPFYTQHVNGNEDPIKWEKIKDHVQKGDYLVLRVKPICTNEKSVAFVGDDLNVKDFVMTEHLFRTLLNCGDNVTISNTTPTTKSAQDLKGTTVTIGEYTLTLDGDLSGTGSSGFTGKGHVEWNPFDLKVMLAVKFENLKINTDGAVYEGIAKTYPGNSLPGIESVQEIFSDWGVDNVIADLEIPFSEQLQNLATDKVSSLAEKYNINAYYTYIKTYGKSLATGDLGNLHLPISVDDAYNGSPIDIQIEEMQFRPTFATMNVIGEMELPESDALENKTLLLGAPYLCISPDRFLPETGNLCLLGDFKLKDPKSGFDIKFIAPDDLQNPLTGCYVSWKDDAFHALQLHAEMSIPDLMKDVDGEAQEGVKPVLTVQTTIDDWKRWRAYATMDNFQVEDLPGYTFHPGTVVIDHHPEENDPAMPMPKGYDKKKGGINSDVQWQGLYMRDLYVSIPNFIENEKSTSATVTNSEDTSGKSADAEIKTENGRIQFELNHLYIDLFNDACDGRFTCKARLNTEKVLTASTNKLGGWGISLDEIYVDMLQSTFVEAGFRGYFEIPLLKDSEGEKAHVNYRAFIPSSDKAGKRMYCFETTQDVDASMDFFLAEVEFDKEQTYFFVEKPEGEDTRVELCLGGTVTVSSSVAESETIKKATSIGFKLPEIEFAHMRLANCPRWKSKGSDVQAAAYDKWLDDVGQKAETEMSDGDKVYFDIGKWSHASPKKKVGGMDFNLQWPSINLSRLAKGQVGLQLGGDLSILDGALAFGLTFNIWANVDWKNKSISYADTNFEEARVKANSGNLAGFKVEGCLVDNSSFFKAVESAMGGGGSSGGSGSSGSGSSGSGSGSSGSSSSSSAGSSDSAGADEMADYVSGDLEAAKQAYTAASETIKKLKGFRGDFQFALPGNLFTFKASGAYVETTKTADEKGYEQGKRWDTLKSVDGNPDARRTSDGTVIYSPSQISIDETYTYAFLEIAVGSKALSAIQPIGITELRGGFYMNCKKKDLNVSFSSENVKAQYGMVGGMIGIGLSCVDEHTITADGDLTVFYDTFHKRLSTIRIKAGMHAVNGSDPKKGLINADVTITYEDNDVTKYFEVDVTADMEADMENALAEFVGSDYVKSLKEFSETSLEEMGEDKGRNTETSEEEKNEQKKKAESTNHLKAGVYINVNFKITWKDKGATLKNSKGKDQPKWHIYIGQPTPDDKRCRITFIDFALGKKSDAFAMWATIYADAYLCLGNELPIDDLPPIPEEISSYLGLKNSNLNQGDKDLNAEIDAGRTKQFSTFKPDGNEGGLMFGAKVYGDMGLNAGIVYANTTAIAGFDVMLLKLKKGTKCIGGGEAGKNGWYGMGQAYALLKGEIGLNIDMWLFSGHIALIDVGMGALLKAGMPNPSWFYGKAKAHYRLLGGLIKGSTSVQLKAGEVCTPEFGNPLDDIEIFNEVKPGDDNQSAGWSKDNVIEASVYPSFTTNMEMETPLRLLDENKAYAMADFDEELEKYSEQASRTYRFMLSPDSIRLARFNVDQFEANNPKPEFDERVTYTTRDHELFKVASGTLDINKLYRLKLSGYAQEWRDGEWGDPFFNDSTTEFKDKRVKWYQTQYYYFRTDPKAPNFDKDVKLFHMDYTDDLARPTMALARKRKAEDHYDDPNNPVSLRFEVSRNANTGWESPSKILHNIAEKQKYDEAVAKRNEAYEKAYKEAMAEYEKKMEQYGKIKEEAHQEWVNGTFNPWMDEHYPGWKDWKFVVRVKEYRQKSIIDTGIIFEEPDIDKYLPPNTNLELEAEIDAELAKEKAAVAKIKEVLLEMLGEKTGVTGKLDAVKDKLAKLGLDRTDNDKFMDLLNKLDGLAGDRTNLDKVVNFIDGLDAKQVSTNSPMYIEQVHNYVTKLYESSQLTGKATIVTTEPATAIVREPASTTTVIASPKVSEKVSTELSTNAAILNVNAVEATTKATQATTKATQAAAKAASAMKKSGPNPDLDFFVQDTVATKRAAATTKTTQTTTLKRATTTTTLQRATTTSSTNASGTTLDMKAIPTQTVTPTDRTAALANEIEKVAATTPTENKIVVSDQQSSAINLRGKAVVAELDEATIVKAGKLTRYPSESALRSIYNHYNPAFGDKSVNGPQHIVIEVDNEGNEEVIINAFAMEGTPYVELQSGIVIDSKDITTEQWLFLVDKDVPEFFYDDPSNPMPVPPTYGDMSGYDLPEVEKPNYQRDMDSKTFQIPIDEYTYAGAVADDFIFLRTKSNINLSFLDQVKALGYNWVRISVNRVHKKAFDDLLAKTDSVIAEYKGHAAVKLDEVMGDGERKGYDSSASMGKGYNENTFIAADGSMDMDAYLNSYIGELEKETEVDSILLQKIRSNIDMKDFSECLYEKVALIPTYKNFKAHYEAVSGDVYGTYVRHQLLSVELAKTGSNDKGVVNGKLWLSDPYYALGYWSKWAMIGGAPPLTYSDFPGLQLELDKSGYRKENHAKYTDGGHLLASPNGSELNKFRNYFMPAMFYNVDRDDNHRYGDSGDPTTTINFLTRAKATNFFRGLIYADCRMAATIRNAVYDIAAMARINANNRIYSLEDVYKKIQVPHEKTPIVINDSYTYRYIDHFSESYTYNNKATFLCYNVPIMIYGDYELFNRKGWPYDSKSVVKGKKLAGATVGAIDAGTVLRNDDWGVIFEHPEISWRLARDIAHPVCVDNCLQDGTFTRSTAASYAAGIKKLQIQSYRLNAFHTKGTSEEYIYDLCLKKNASNQYELGVGLETLDETFDTKGLEEMNYKLEISK